MKDSILLIPDKPDIERDAVADAWLNAGGEVLRIGEFWNPPTISDKEVKVYGNSMFCLVLEQKLGLQLISPSDYILDGLDDEWVKRDIRFTSFYNSKEWSYPLFVKPVVPKIFIAGVFNSEEELLANCVGLDGSTEVIISNIVEIESEVRSFILEGKIRDLAVYEGTADLEEARQFLERFLSENSKLLPSTIVVDLGYLKRIGWCVIEANPTWGAGLNGCSAKEVIESIYRATK